MAKYFYNVDGEVLPIQNQYKGQACFIIAGGPSLKNIDIAKLSRPGFVTIGINNSAKVFRPNLWVSVDDPANFMISIWRDPKITKFCMLGKRGKILWDNNNWSESKYTVKNCPNIVYYQDNEYFKPTDEFLTEETINWGNHTNRCECGAMRQDKKIKECPVCKKNMFGCRSVLLATIKIAYVLGFRKVFLLGTDFKMSAESTYAWEQSRAHGAVSNNNITYKKLNDRFNLLRPIFERHGFYVFNASGDDSGLNSFVKIDYEDAIKIVTKDFPDTDKERSYGMYERKAINENVEKKTVELQDIKKKIIAVNGSDKRTLKKLNQKLSKVECKLKTALEDRERILTWKA